MKRKSLAEQLCDLCRRRGGRIGDDRRIADWEHSTKHTRDWWRFYIRAARRLCAGPGEEELCRAIEKAAPKGMHPIFREGAAAAMQAMRACFAKHRRKTHG
jgi:hypothetical protein